MNCSSECRRVHSAAPPSGTGKHTFGSLIDYFAGDCRQIVELAKNGLGGYAMETVVYFMRELCMSKSLLKGDLGRVQFAKLPQQEMGVSWPGY